LSHKEYRFIYPAVVCMIILSSIGFAEVLSAFSRSRRLRRYRDTFVTLSLVGVILAAVLLPSRFTDADAQDLGLPEILYASPERTLWVTMGNRLKLLHYLSREAGICGLGVWNRPHFDGGYTHLHKDVPVFVNLRNNQEFFGDNASRINYVIAGHSFAHVRPEYVKQKCLGKWCAYSRPGGCTQSDLGDSPSSPRVSIHRDPPFRSKVSAYSKAE
jgi:hypothetical protein